VKIPRRAIRKPDGALRTSSIISENRAGSYLRPS
jgi:hypothetical protein